MRTRLSHFERCAPACPRGAQVAVMQRILRCLAWPLDHRQRKLNATYAFELLTMRPTPPTRDGPFPSAGRLRVGPERRPTKGHV